MDKLCLNCAGTNKVDGETCPACDGSGRMPMISIDYEEIIVRLEAELAEMKARWAELRAYLVESGDACDRLMATWEGRGNDTEVYAFDCRKTEVIEAIDELDRLSVAPVDCVRVKVAWNNMMGNVVCVPDSKIGDEFILVRAKGVE